MNRHQRRAEKHSLRQGLGGAARSTVHVANLLCQQGRFTEAAAKYRHALALEPNDPQTHHSLANALRSQGQFSSAIAAYRQAIARKPDFAEAQNNLGVTLHQQGCLDEAIALYRSAIRHRPDFAEAHDNLGLALSEQGATEAAIDCHRRAIDLMPAAPEPYNHLGVALRRQGASDAAIACYQRAIELRPGFIAAYNNLGVALHDQHRPDMEVLCYRKALEYAPDYADAHANLGVALQELGDLDAAFAAFERAVELAPQRGAFHRMLAETGRVAPGDPAMRRLEALSAASASLPVADRIEVHFALGLLHASFGRAGESLPHLLAGNRLQRERTEYDEAATLSSFNVIKDVFSKETLATCNGSGTASPIPIFVIGMPRSGTTLVEQIFASHPAVHGAGELPDLQQLVAAGKSCLTDMTQEDWRAVIRPDPLASIVADYVDGLKARAPSASHVVDKMPDNFLLAGLIRMALPAARIVHVVRDPLDTCMSCFSRLFNTGVGYSYDLAELGRYHRAYRDLMSHWERVLPADAMLTIRYEELVKDAAGQVDRLLSHCNLTWDERCLAFHETRRPVRTASAAQVRQPLYETSVGRWHGFADMVRPFLDDPATMAPG